MTLKKRRCLFYSLVIAFFIAGGGVLLYVNGWRFDTKNFKLEKVGAIFVRSAPENVKIYLDGRAMENKSGFLQSGTFISGLFPKTHDLKLALDGYKDWRENVSVAPGLVSEVKYAVLIPENTQTAATGTIKNFLVQGDNILAGNQDGKLLLNGKKIGNGGIVGWTNDSQYALSRNPTTGIYYWNNATTGAAINLSALLKKIGFNTAKQFSILTDPYDPRRVIVRANNKVNLLDVGHSLLIGAYVAGGGKYISDAAAASQYYLAMSEFSPQSDTSTIIVYDKFLQKIRGITPELPGQSVKLAWGGNNELGILQNGGELYAYDISSGNAPRKIADDVKYFAFNSDGSAVAALENSSLETIPLNSGGDYHRFNLPDVGSATNIFWYGDDEHIFVVYPDKIMFLDLEDASLVNFATVTQTPRAAYNATNNALYFLDGGSIKKLEFPK